MSPDIGKDHFKDRPEPGLTVYYWPKGDVSRDDPNVSPQIGIIQKGWDLGIADITILPNQEGAVDFKDNAFHIGDRRCLNHIQTGISDAARIRGIWEFTPLSKFYLTLKGQMEAAKELDKPSEPSESKPDNKKQKA